MLLQRSNTNVGHGITEAKYSVCSKAIFKWNFFNQMFTLFSPVEEKSSMVYQQLSQVSNILLFDEKCIICVLENVARAWNKIKFKVVVFLIKSHLKLQQTYWPYVHDITNSFKTKILNIFLWSHLQINIFHLNTFYCRSNSPSCRYFCSFNSVFCLFAMSLFSRFSLALWMVLWCIHCCQLPSHANNDFDVN